jgi:hypothetical protein
VKVAALLAALWALSVGLWCVTPARFVATGHAWEWDGGAGGIRAHAEGDQGGVSGEAVTVQVRDKRISP